MSADISDDAWGWDHLDDAGHLDADALFCAALEGGARQADNNPLAARQDDLPTWWEFYDDPVAELVWLDVVQANAPPDPPPADVWTWSDDVDLLVIQGSVQQADVAAVGDSAALPDDVWDWQGDTPPSDVFPGSRQQADVAFVGPNQLFEDYQDSYDDEDYDLFIDDYCNTEPEGGLADGWVWDSDTEDSAAQDAAADSQPVGADVAANPEQQAPGAWPWDDECEDTLASDVAIDSQPVGPDVAVQPEQPPAGAWPHDDDAEDTLATDVAIDSEPVGADFVANPEQQAPAAWPWDDDAEDECLAWVAFVSAAVGADNVPAVVTPGRRQASSNQSAGARPGNTAGARRPSNRN